jgi:hypothetical protein
MLGRRTTPDKMKQRDTSGCSQNPSRFTNQRDWREPKWLSSFSAACSRADGVNGHGGSQRHSGFKRPRCQHTSAAYRNEQDIVRL